MKSINITGISYKYLLILLTIFVLSGCEGLDDWSDLQNVDLFDNKTEEEEGNTFKRYNEPAMSSRPLIEFIVDESSKLSKSYSKEIRKACDYTKLPFHTINLKSWNSSHSISATSRVLCIFDTKKINDASIPKLIDFVSNGGTLFIPYANEDKRMSFLLGFKPEAEYATDLKSMGWYFNTPMLPGLKEKTYSGDLGLYGFAAQNFSSKVKILATAINNPKYPAIVENPIGKGRVILYNTSGEFIKGDRGFLFAAVLKGLEGIPYPVANTSTIFLDDFPSPQYEMRVEPVASELNVNMADFVNNIWWPDMKKLAKEFKIPYAAMTTFDYRNKIVPPFTLDQWNAEKITVNNKTEPLTDWLVKDAAKNGHELAFHGYNHVSLLTHLWKNQQFIGTSMNTVKKKWEISNFGKLPTTYVPPSNEIDKKGIIELKKAMPSLKYMCSLYLGQIYDGGNREFDYDPYHKDFFDYPRVSSGFYLNDDRKYNLQSLYLISGIWTHFVHPDDIFQIPDKNTPKNELSDLRNGESLGWYKSKGKDKAMFPEFRGTLKQMTNLYPQLRFVTANDGAKIVIDWRASRYTHQSENGLYTVKENNPDSDTKQYWFMYASAANAERVEARLKTQVNLYSKTPFMDGYLYSAYATKPRLTVLDLNYKGPKEKAQQAKINALVKADFAKFKESTKKFLRGDDGVDSDKMLKLEMAALKNKMLNTASIDSVTWNKYAKYMAWTDRGDEVWKMLEDHVSKYPTKNNVMYSKELDRVIGYPNDLVKEKWMSAQLLVTPNDKDLLNSYVANFYTDENQEKIKNALKALLSVDTSKSSYLNYIRHLLQFKPEEARTELSGKKATEELSEVATQIVWLFADNNEYQKALEWSAFSTEIDFLTKMEWMIELRQYKQLDKEFLAYIAEHPEDYKAKALMSSVYHETSRFKDSWVLANSLPEGPEKEELRKMLNKDVVFEDEPLQQDLIANHSELFYPNVLKSIVKEERLKKGDFLDLMSSLETNQSNNAIQKNELSYNHFDKKGNIHSIAGTYNQLYKQQLSDLNYENNFDNTLMGLQYKFITSEKEGKPQYWSRARVEVDKASKLFYEFGIGLTSSKEKNFRSAEFNLFPVETAPGLNEGIYQMRLNLYQDFYLFKIINTSVSFEGDYYTNGLLSRDTIVNQPILNPELDTDRSTQRKTYTPIDSQRYTVSDVDNSYGGSLTVRLMLDDGRERRSKFIPFIESQYSRGSRDLSSGFPYWLIKSRLYEGAGLGWKLKITNLETKLEASYFFDDYADNFQRYTGYLSYQIFDFTALTANVELFSQDKFYSNSFQLGIKYNLKKRVKRK